MANGPLSEKTIVMLVGPSAVGKSTIMNCVSELDREFSRVSGFTTRAKRPGDEVELYRYLTQEEANAVIQSNALVQYACNPANNQIYGTELSDYPNKFNMKDTLSGAVENFTRLPFNDHHIISVTVPVEPWLNWLNARYPSTSIERVNRLREAKQSIEWSLAQHHNHSWVVNRPGDIASAANAVISQVRGNTTIEPPTEAKIMLKTVNDLLSYQ